MRGIVSRFQHLHFLTLESEKKGHPPWEWEGWHFWQLCSSSLTQIDLRLLREWVRLGGESFSLGQREESLAHSSVPSIPEPIGITAVRRGGGTRDTQGLFLAPPWLAPPLAAILKERLNSWSRQFSLGGSRSPKV